MSPTRGKNHVRYKHDNEFTTLQRGQKRKLGCVESVLGVVHVLFRRKSGANVVSKSCESEDLRTKRGKEACLQESQDSRDSDFETKDADDDVGCVMNFCPGRGKSRLKKFHNEDEWEWHDPQISIPGTTFYLVFQVGTVALWIL
jgi:hypothetical protein